MNDEYRLCWVHTVPCSECQGSHTEYRAHLSCKGCPMLLETLQQRGLLAAPSIKSNRIKVYELYQNGMGVKDISDQTGLKVRTVSQYIQQFRTDSGLTKKYKKRGVADAKQT
jgi:hypothetical protein